MPSVDLEISNPQIGLPALVRALDWFALIEPSLEPVRIRTAATELQLDLLDAASLDAVGLRTSEKMRVKLDPATRTLTAELAVKDRKRVLAHLDQLMTKNEKRPEVARWGDAVLIDGGTAYLIAIVLEKKRLFVQLPEAPRLSFFEDPSARMRLPAAKKAPKRWSDHPRLGPLAALKKSKKFVAPKLETARSPDVYFRSKASDASAAGALVADGAGFDLHLLWALSGREQVAIGEILSPKARARSLLDETPLDAALSVRGRLVGSGAQLLIERLGVPAALTQGLPGGFHLVLTQRGELVLEIESGDKLGEPTRAVLQKALQERVSAAKVSLDPEAKRLGLSVGVVDPAGLRKLGEPEYAPLVADLKPEHLLSVLGGVKDRFGPRYRLNNVELMAARMVIEPLVRATKTVHLELSPRGAALMARADVRYRD